MVEQSIQIKKKKYRQLDLSYMIIRSKNEKNKMTSISRMIPWEGQLYRHCRFELYRFTLDDHIQFRKYSLDSKYDYICYIKTTTNKGLEYYQGYIYFGIASVNLVNLNKEYNSRIPGDKVFILSTYDYWNEDFSRELYQKIGVQGTFWEHKRYYDDKQY